MENLKYDSYPEKCPPQTAAEIEGIFFRYCDGEVPSETDFLTHVDLQLSFPESKLCQAKALSFYDNLESAEKLKKRFPKFRKKTITKVTIKKSFGVGEINKSHLNLWEYAGLNFFDLVKDQLEGVS